MSRQRHHNNERRNNDTSSSHGRSNPNWDEQQRSNEDWSRRRDHNDHRFNDMGYGSRYGSRYEDNNRSGDYYDTYDNNRDRGYNNSGSGLQGYRTDKFSRSDSSDESHYGSRRGRMNFDDGYHRYSGFSDNSLFEDELNGRESDYDNSYSGLGWNERNGGYRDDRNQSGRNGSSQRNRNDYESRTNDRSYGSNYNDRNEDDRNFFERTGDRIKRGFNNIRERGRDRDHEKYGYRSVNSYRENENSYDNDYNRNDNYDDQDNYSGNYRSTERFPEDRSQRTRRNFAEYDLDRYENNNRRRSQQEEDAW